MNPGNNLGEEAEDKLAMGLTPEDYLMSGTSRKSEAGETPGAAVL